MPRFRCLRAALCALFVLVPAGLAGQAARSVALPGEMSPPAGARYDAGGLHQLLLGENYRPLWTTPLAIPVLDPDTFAGGLTLLREGGGRSTESLRLKGADGREYVLRSVDKNITPAVPPDLHGTLVHTIAQDLISAEHPGAALVAEPLLRAANVLHATPRLYRVPDHPFLDSTRTRFRHRVALLEVRPTDGWARTVEVEGSEDFRRLLEEDPVNRVHAHAVLTARLMDLYLGDWDRGWDQWRWARIDGGGLHWWIPIPRDRDNAFFHAEGLVPALVRSRMPTLTRFRARIGSALPFHSHAAQLDRLLLSGLPRQAWDSTAEFLRARLTDAVIDSAVGRLPPEYGVLQGDALAAVLRARRDGLPQAAARFYRLAAREVDVHVTDQAERAEIGRLPNGAVDVTVYTEGGYPGQPYFHRQFLPSETREVRLYLHGGDDRVTVRGADGGIVVPGAQGGVLVRVIGGGGDDEFRHHARDRGRTLFYDDKGSNHVERARLDRRAWQPPERTSVWGTSPRDWGSAMSPLAPYAAWRLNVGPVLGAGPVWTRHGFRRDPYAQRLSVQALWAPTELGFGGRLQYDRRRTNRPASVWLNAHATNFEDVRFHGLGNDSPDDADDDDFVVEQTQLQVQAAYEVHPRWWRLFAGPVVKWTNPGEVRAATPGLRGDESFWQMGAAGGVELDGRDHPLYPRKGGRVSLLAEGYGTDRWSPFARFTGGATGYLSVPGRGGPTLALRAEGQAAVGEFPFQESAFVGGLGTLRGFVHQRFRGDAALAGSAELRVPIAYVNLGLARVHLGGFGLADAGRVYLDGDSPDGWHTGYGGGLSFRTLGYAATVAWAYGERGSLYATLGMPF
ncbi:MAG TPA: BamA/TamA family outer membrane protein [Longimicrobium sp.]|nr:BamA/TamA family outer membrane protein [Longimicrobium sp.]